MKKLITILGMIGISTISLNAQIQEYVFDGRDYLDCVVDAKALDYNGDGIPDAFMIAYDLNKNGKIDHFAQYEQYKDSLGKVRYYYNPSLFYHDDNEDGILESVHIDKNRDGVLESFEKNPKVKEKKEKIKIKRIYL